MRIRLSGLVLAASILLTGCGTPSPEPTRTLHPTPSPVFSSDAEALAAAIDAYAKYQSMEDQITNEGGANPDRIRPFASRDALEGALASYASMRNAGQHATGHLIFRGSILKSYDATSTATLDAVVVATCIDVSNVDLVNSSGASLVPSDRVDRQPFTLTFDVRERSLVLANRVKTSAEAAVCD